MVKSEQILKSREDKFPLLFSRCSEDKKHEDYTKFKLADSLKSSWVKSGDIIGEEIIRSRIEPWLTALFQSEHLSLLVGSGLSNGVHELATGNKLPGMGWVDFQNSKDDLDAAVSKSATDAGRDKGNIEDQIRVANELIRGLEILAHSDSKKTDEAAKLATELSSVIQKFASSILDGERGLLEADPAKRVSAFNYLVSFLMSFSSRTGTRDRLQIFTTNYDRFIEAGADVAGLHLIDRFVGTLAPVYRSSRLDIDMHYNPPGIRGEPRYLEGVAKFTKLHGSLDWVKSDRNIHRIGLPFGAQTIEPYLRPAKTPAETALQLMIYPNSAKDWETTLYPYADLFRDFASAVCRPNSTLVTFGYSFGDDHINRVIEDMLTIPSSHLVVISHGDPLGRIMQTYERLGRTAQISLMVGNHLGDLQQLVDNYLPKPAIDRTTFRMAELLSTRWSVKSKGDGEEATKSDHEKSDAEGELAE